MKTFSSTNRNVACTCFTVSESLCICSVVLRGVCLVSYAFISAKPRQVPHYQPRELCTIKVTNLSPRIIWHQEFHWLIRAPELLVPRRDRHESHRNANQLSTRKKTIHAVIFEMPLMEWNKTKTSCGHDTWPFKQEVSVARAAVVAMETVSARTCCNCCAVSLVDVDSILPARL